MGENNSKKEEMRNADPFVTVDQDGKVSKEKFETEYLAELSVPFKDRQKIKVMRASEVK